MAMGEILQQQATKLIADKGGRQKLGEEPILDLVNEICDATTERGEWINTLDIVGTSGVLQLERKTAPGKCGNECKAIVKACEYIRSVVGESDMAEKLFSGPYTEPGKEFASVLCNQLTPSCKSPPKKLKKRRVDEKFDEYEPQVPPFRRAPFQPSDGGHFRVIAGGCLPQGTQSAAGNHSSARVCACAHARVRTPA
jgi:hypothetical protein